MGKQSVGLLAQTEILSKGQNQGHPGGAGDLGLVKGPEFEISEALGYHQTAFLESHLIGEFSGFLSCLYIIQPDCWEDRGFFLSQKNYPALSRISGRFDCVDLKYVLILSEKNVVLIK
jgi:hypothetical protein